LQKRRESEQAKMRFNFDVYDRDIEQRRSVTPKDEVEWVPLQNHPIFTPTSATADHASTTAALPRNLVAWDGASRIYFWDLDKQCLHRISIRLGEPQPTSVLAASPTKVPSFSLSLSLSHTHIYNLFFFFYHCLGIVEVFDKSYVEHFVVYVICAEPDRAV
jgi:hypothetical protein